MEAIYRLKTSELNEDFLKAVRKIFKGKEVDITIATASDAKGKSEFIEAIEDVKLRKNIVSFSPDDFKEFSSRLAAK